jgi:hypothetical protein
MGALDQLQPQQGSRHFNGVIDVEGQQVRVVDGVVDFEGEKYFVSDDGRIVVDKNRRFVGIIQNGKFVLGTPEIVEQLKGSGIFHGEQSQDVASQPPI